MSFIRIRQFLGCLVIIVISNNSFANLIIGGTRIIFYENNIESSVNISNEESFPILMKTWIENPFNRNDQIKNIIISPTLSKVNPHTNQVVRLHLTSINHLPSNKESLFWLNIMEIQPKQHIKVSNVEIAYKHRIKVFYRPLSISDINKIIRAPENIVWRIQDKHTLLAENPSPYFINLTKITLRQNLKSFVINADLIPPFSTVHFKVHDTNLYQPIKKIDFNYINDWGLVKTQRINFR